MIDFEVTVLCMILILFRHFGGVCCLHLLCVWIRFSWLLKCWEGGSVSIVQGSCSASTTVAERKEVLYRASVEIRLPFSGLQTFRNVRIMWHYMPEFSALAMVVGRWYGSPFPIYEPVSQISGNLMWKLCHWKPSNVVFPNILLSDVKM